jgi:hypothetical protein
MLPGSEYLCGGNNVFAGSSDVRRWSRLPPGPIGWPVVGSLFSLPGPRNVPACRKFATLAQKYGPIVFLRMGLRPTLIVSDCKIAQEFFTDCDETFGSRPQFASGRHLGYGYSSTVFSSGKEFKKMRRIYKSELLSGANVTIVAPLRREETRVLLAHVLRHAERATNRLVNITSLLFQANLNLMGRMVFSQRLFGDPDADNAQPPEIENFKLFVKSATRLVGSFNIGDYIPALRRCDIQGDVQFLLPCQQKFVSDTTSLNDVHNVYGVLLKFSIRSPASLSVECNSDGGLWVAFQGWRGN